MQLTYYAPAHCFLRRKIEGAAKIAGVAIERKENAEADVTGVLLPRYPSLLTPTGLVCGSNASMRYIGEAFPATELCGSSVTQRAMTASSVDTITAELETPILGFVCGAPKDRVAADLKVALAVIDAALKKQTYIAGQRLSIADLSLAAAVAGSLDKGIFTTEDIASMPHVARHLNTVSGRCQWGIEVTITPAAAPAAAVKEKEAKKAEKEEKKAEKEVKKAEKEDKPAEEKKAEAPKAKDPIELLEPTDFDMDAWKRKYSNTKDLKGEAMPYLWEKLDTKGWSFWRFKFIRSSEEENTQVFKASNLLGMFLQRIDNWLRKYMFAVCNVLPSGDGKHFEVEGILLTRGQDIPVKLAEHDQFPSFEWKKLSTEKDRDMIAHWFCEDEEVEGRVISDCKVYK